MLLKGEGEKKMKDRNVLISIILIVSMLAMVSVPAVRAWE
jgi:hypothetical protein